MNSISNLKSNNQKDISGSRNKAKHFKMRSKIFSIFEIKSLLGASVVGLLVFVVNQARAQNTSFSEATTQLRHSLLSLDTFHTLFCTIAGVLGFYLLFKIFKTLFLNRVRFDRVLAEMRLRILILTFVFILSFPCSIAILFNLFSSIKPYELLYDEQQYVSRPQVHEATIKLDTIFSNNVDPFNNQISLKLSLETRESKDSIQQILENNAEDPSIFWTTFYHFHDPGNQHMTGTPRGRFWAWFIGILGSILLTGILISSIVNYIERRIDRWKQGLIHYKFKKDEYVVIIGGHDSVPRIIKQVLNKYTTLKYIIVVTEHDIPTYRQHLSSYLTESEINKLVLYRGERDSKNDIEGVNVHYNSLKAVYIIGEQGSDGFMEPSNDARNLECLNLIYKSRKEKVDKSSTPLSCFVMFEHQTTYSAFVYSDTSKDFKKLISLTPFSFYELWAQKVLSSCPLSENNDYWPIDQEFSLDENKKNPINVKGIDRYSDKRVHFIIIGMSRMGAELAKEVATICHYPNFVQQEIDEEIQLLVKENNKISSKKGELRTKITIIDPDIETQMNLFMNRSRDLFELSKWTYIDSYIGKQQVSDNLNTVDSSAFPYSHLIESRLTDSNFIDTEWEFIKGRAEDSYIANYLRESVNNKDLVTIAVCIPKDEVSASIAANLPAEVQKNSLQILVYQRNSRHLIDQLSGKSSSVESSLRYYRIKPFGMLSECFDHQIIDYMMAKIIHYSKNKKDGFNKAEMDWSGKTLLNRWSSIYSSHAWSVSFRSLNFNFVHKNKDEFVQIFKNPEIKSIYGRVEHNRWLMERLLLIKQRPLTVTEWEDFKNAVKIQELEYPILFDNYYDVYKSDTPTGLNERQEKLLDNIDAEKKSKQKSIMQPHVCICSYWMLRHRDVRSLHYDVDRYERIERSYDDFFKEDLI